MIKWQESFNQDVDYSDWEGHEVGSIKAEELLASNMVKVFWSPIKDQKVP